MPYDENNRPSFLNQPSELTHADRAETITPGASDALDPAGNYYKYVSAGTSGDVTFVPYRNEDADTITITLAGGQIIPGRVRRVTAATATVIGWFD